MRLTPVAEDSEDPDYEESGRNDPACMDSDSDDIFVETESPKRLKKFELRNHSWQ